MRFHHYSFIILIILVASIASAGAFSVPSWFADIFSRSSGNVVVESACDDSDGGIDESVQGTITGPDAYGGNNSLESNYVDRCENNSMLLEFSCGSEGIIGMNLSCAEGCSDGVCLDPPVVPANTSQANNASSGTVPENKSIVLPFENKSTVINPPPNKNTVVNPPQDNDIIEEGTYIEFPDPLTPESEDFFEEFIIEDFLTPDDVANAQPDLPSFSIAPDEPSVNERVVIAPGDEDLYLPIDKLLLNLTVNMTSKSPRLIGRGTYIDKSLLLPQFLPNVRPDAGLYANCDFISPNISSTINNSFPRGSSTLLYVSALSPSFKCPRTKNLDMEISYRLVNAGIAEVYPDGVPHACRSRWYSPSLNQSGISVVRTPFVVQRVIVPPQSSNEATYGTFVVPVRSGSAINFNHFQYTSPRVVYLEAFRGDAGDYVSMEFTLVRCVEGKGVPRPNPNLTRSIGSDEIPEPTFLKKMKCTIASIFGSDYESCLYT